MRRALGLLGASDAPMARVAAEAGFSDARSLRRAIKRWTGQTPSACGAMGTEPQARWTRGRLHGRAAAGQRRDHHDRRAPARVFFNRAAEQVFGVAAHEALGQPLDRFIPQRQQMAHRRHVDRFGRSGKTARHMGRLHELAGQRADGEVFLIEASISRAPAKARSS